jgi:hypothetical protein
MSASVRSPTTLVFVDRDGTEKVVGRLDACRPDLALVDALARLQLVARGRGRRLCVRDPTAELSGLLALVGLTDALGVEPRRQAEVGEVLGPDEVVQPGDPPA